MKSYIIKIFFLSYIVRIYYNLLWRYLFLVEIPWFVQKFYLVVIGDCLNIFETLWNLIITFFTKSLVCSVMSLWSAVSVNIWALQTPELQTTDWVLVCLSVQCIYTPTLHHHFPALRFIILKTSPLWNNFTLLDTSFALVLHCKKLS